jgi:thiosulfate/3-mercaptopyruvate sulfurtransferase
MPLFSQIRKTVIFVIFFVTLLASHATLAVTLPSPLVDTEWLAKNRESVVILDIRDNADSFHKRSKRGKAAVNPCGVRRHDVNRPVAGHIPGAVLLRWRKIVSKRKVDGMKLSNMLLDKKPFEKLMSKKGLKNDSTVVLVSNGEGPKDVIITTRLYWTMKYYGHKSLAILDGGTKKWIAERRKVVFKKNRPPRSNYKVTKELKRILATKDDVAKAIKNDPVQIIDNRALQDYIGLTFSEHYTSPDRKGHIPTAKNWSVATLFNTRGIATFHPTQVVSQVANLLGIDTQKPSIVYCWSGGMASTSWFIMHELLDNNNVRLYDGSLNEWTKHKALPMVTMEIE